MLIYLDLTTSIPSDNRIIKQLREKLKKVLKTELAHREFQHKITEEMENKIIDKVLSKKKESIYFEYDENKVRSNISLADKNSPLNPSKPTYSAAPHDHISSAHFLKNPEEADQQKWKYLALYDIILDEHLRQIRPGQPEDDSFAYVGKDNKPAHVRRDDTYNNMYFDYNFSLDNEFYKEFVNHVKANAPKGIDEEQEDPVYLFI